MNVGLGIFLGFLSIVIIFSIIVISIKRIIFGSPNLNRAYRSTNGALGIDNSSWLSSSSSSSSFSSVSSCDGGSFGGCDGGSFGGCHG